MRATILLVGLSLVACTRVDGNGTLRTEARAVTEVSAVSVGGGLELVALSGPAGLTVEGDENLLALVVTRVDQGTLYVHPKDGTSLNPTRPITVTVTVPKLRELVISGGSDARLEGGTDRQLEVSVSGGGSFVAKVLDVDALQLSASGGCDVALAGRARHAMVEVSGGVEAAANELEVNHAVVDVTGGSNLSVTVTEAIAGHASGGSEATVLGSPPRRHVITSGGSDVTYL